uniref:Proteasome subunit beta type-3 n=1 Tax=Acartia pacifica TaxID=335913 RepID=A0A0U2T715_ACAPC|nr:proteasome subunit beta type-3-like protein [Acartia pacifica]
MSISGVQRRRGPGYDGDKCVAIASDLRYGRELQTISTDFPKVFEMNPHLWVGLPGLATDIQTVLQKLEFRKNMYELKESRQMKPKTFANMISNMLYERRFGPFFVEPIVAGLDPVTFEPYVCCMDLIGCITTPKDYVVGGTPDEQMHGMCETLWEPNMGPDELFESISQALMNGMDRDGISGWGAVVHIIEKDKVTTRTLKTRMD